jgi:hypothetical protein
MTGAHDDQLIEADSSPSPSRTRTATRRSIVLGAMGAAITGCIGGDSTTPGGTPGTGEGTPRTAGTATGTPEAIGEVSFADQFAEDPSENWSGAGLTWAADGGAEDDGSLTISQAAVSSGNAGPAAVSPSFPVQPQAYYEVEFDAETARDGLIAMYHPLPLGGKVGSDAYTSILSERGLGASQSYMVRGRVGEDETVLRVAPAGSPVELDAISVTRVTPERVAEWSDAVIERAAPVSYDPPDGRFDSLPETRSTIVDGGSLTVVMVGDSIVNDVANGHPDVLLERANEGLDVELVVSVRGSTGVGWFAQKERYRDHILSYDPDLVVAGGVSTEEASEYRALIDALSVESSAEFLAMTGGISPPDWKYTFDDAALREAVASIASEQDVGFFDSRRPFEAYLDRTGIRREELQRDFVHGNSRAKAIMARFLARFLNPDG